jgi:hypothetical protein
MCITIALSMPEASDLWPTIIGAVIGAVGAIIGGFVGIFWQTRRIEKEYENKKCRVRNAIFVEMNELWNEYNESIMKPLNEKIRDRYINLRPIYAIPTVYNENSSFLAELGEKDFVSKIIRFYMLFNTINEQATFISRDYWLSQEDGRDPNLHGLKNRRRDNAADYLKVLRGKFEQLASELLQIKA